MYTLALVIEIQQPMAAGFIYIYITALAELYRNLPYTAVEITPCTRGIEIFAKLSRN